MYVKLIICFSHYIFTKQTINIIYHDVPLLHPHCSSYLRIILCCCVHPTHVQAHEYYVQVLGEANLSGCYLMLEHEPWSTGGPFQWHSSR